MLDLPEPLARRRFISEGSQIPAMTENSPSIPADLLDHLQFLSIRRS